MLRKERAGSTPASATQMTPVFAVFSFLGVPFPDFGLLRVILFSALTPARNCRPASVGTLGRRVILESCLLGGRTNGAATQIPCYITGSHRKKS